MPRKRQEANQTQQVDDQQLQQLLQALASQSGMQELKEQPQIVQGVDATKLISSLIMDKPSEEKPPLEELEHVKTTIEELLASARRLVEPFIKDGVLRNLHPIYSRTVLDARLDAIAWALSRQMDKILAEIEQAQKAGADPEKLRELVYKFYNYQKLANWLLIIAYDYMLHHLFASGPGRSRPPLVNIQLGYDIV